MFGFGRRGSSESPAAKAARRAAMKADVAADRGGAELARLMHETSPPTEGPLPDSESVPLHLPEDKQLEAADALEALKKKMGL